MADEQQVVKPQDVPGAAQGLGGPNPTPAFGNAPQTDANRPIEKKEDFESFEEGARAASTVTGPFSVSDELLATANAGEEQDGFVQYAAPSIPRLIIGKWSFENGVLRIKADEKEAFEKLVNASSSLVKQAVSAIDRESGEAVARRFLDSQGKTVQGMATSASEPAATRPDDPRNRPADSPAPKLPA